MQVCKPPEIVLLGAGNLANHLGLALFEAGIKVRQVVNRTRVTGEALAKRLNATFVSQTADMDRNADVYILAVSDHALHHFATHLRLPNKLVIHLSGSVDMEILTSISTQTAVLYPLLTFPKEQKVDFREVPICIEANSSANLEQMREIANKISAHVYMVDSIQRQWLHLAAVFASNFTNFMFTLSQDVVRAHGIDFELLRPLIRQTVKNAEYDHAFDFQTGPAFRNDLVTLHKHRQLLESNPAYRDIYDLISEDIIQYKNRNGKL